MPRSSLLHAVPRPAFPPVLHPPFFSRLRAPCSLALLLASLAASQSAFVNFEGKQTNPIRLSPDGSRLFAVNTPDARLSVFDLANPLQPILMAEIPVGIEPVSVLPIDNDQAWVVNEVSDSVSVVSVASRSVRHTILLKDEPADAVLANGRVFVSVSRRNEIAVIDPATFEAIANIAVAGHHPRALAVSPDGARVYAAFALAGNGTTILPPDRAPSQPPPTNPALPPPPQVGLIVNASDPRIPYSMSDHDVVAIRTDTLAVDRYYSGVGAVNLALAVHPANGDLWIANTEARNLVRFEPVLRGNFISNRLTRVRPADGTTTHFDLNPGFTYSGFPNALERSNALAQPTALAFGPSGSHAYVASFGTDRIAQIDTAANVIMARIELNPDAPGDLARPRSKRGPRGLALKPGAALYALNRLANSISVVDLKTRRVAGEFPVGSHDPTPAAIREGRGFLYDAKLSGSGTASCASCHIDGDMDFLAWDLGDPGGDMATNRVRLSPQLPEFVSVFHPMKGPMVTQTLRGLNGADPLHWRGDRTNFLHFNGAFDSLLGGTILSAEDMEAYRTFIHTLRFQPNPNQNLDRTFPTAFPTRNGTGNAEAGRQTFVNEFYQPQLQLTCNTCHALPTGSANVIIPAIALQESQDFKVPHLRNVYQKLEVDFAPGADSRTGFGIIHDGIDPDLFTFLSRPVFGVFANDSTRKRNLDAFVQCFDTGTAPAVGYTRTVNGTLASEADDDWTLLEGQAAAANIDLVVKGLLPNGARGLVYQPGPNRYAPDRSGVTPLTRAELQAMAAGGAVLSLMGVPVGSGQRMGVDRDEDGLLDGDEPVPSLHIAQSSGQAVVSWPTNGSGYVLELSERLPAAEWRVAPGVRGVVDDQFAVTNQPAGDRRYFRLRSLEF